MKRISHLLIIGIVLLATGNAWADDASKAAKVEEFFRLSKLERTYSQVIHMVAEQAKAGVIQQIRGAKVTPEMEADIDAYFKQISDLVSEYMGWEKLKPEYVQLYADAYTEEELDAIVAFYASPVGQSMVEKTPTLMAKSSEISQRKLAAASPVLQQMMQEWVTRMTEKYPRQPQP